MMVLKRVKTDSVHVYDGVLTGKTDSVYDGVLIGKTDSVYDGVLTGKTYSVPYMIVF